MSVSMREISILIPVSKPPSAEDQRINSIKNIISKLKFFVNVHVVWVVYFPSESKILSLDKQNDFIVDYSDYENALDILDKFQPDVVLSNGMLEFVNLSFILGAKFRKIPLITTFFLPQYIYEQQSIIIGLKQQIRFVLRNKFPDVNLTIGSQPKAIPYFKQKYVFLKQTIKKIYTSKIDLLNFFILFSKLRLYGVFKIHPILSGDLNLCSSMDWKKYLENAGFKKNSIKITGNPFYDILFQNVNLIKDLNVKKKSILFCPSPMHEHGQWTKEKEFGLLKNVLEELLKNKFHITLKIHPSSSDYSEFHEFLINNNFDIKLFQKENLFDLLKNHETLLTYGPGSVTLYGILMKKPIVVLNFFKENEFGHADPSITTYCTKISDLISKINESKLKINDDLLHDYIERNVFKFDGKCSERAAIEIIDFLNSKNE